MQSCVIKDRIDYSYGTEVGETNNRKTSELADGKWYIIRRTCEMNRNEKWKMKWDHSSVRLHRAELFLGDDSRKRNDSYDSNSSQRYFYCPRGISITAVEIFRKFDNVAERIELLTTMKETQECN